MPFAASSATHSWGAPPGPALPRRPALNAETRKPWRSAEKKKKPAPQPASAALRALCASALECPLLLKLPLPPPNGKAHSRRPLKPDMSRQRTPGVECSAIGPSSPPDQCPCSHIWSYIAFARARSWLWPLFSKSRVLWSRSAVSKAEPIMVSQPAAANPTPATRHHRQILFDSCIRFHTFPAQQVISLILDAL